MHGGYQKKMAGINLEVLKDPYPNYCTLMMALESGQINNLSKQIQYLKRGGLITNLKT